MWVLGVGGVGGVNNIWPDSSPPWMQCTGAAAPGVLDPLIPVTSEQREGEGEGRPRLDIGCP